MRIFLENKEKLTGRKKIPRITKKFNTNDEAICKTKRPLRGGGVWCIFAEGIGVLAYREPESLQIFKKIFFLEVYKGVSEGKASISVRVDE